jgi:hypothetical protein
MITTKPDTDSMPINCFREGTELELVGVSAIGVVKVTHISDCGVTISGTFSDGKPLGQSYVISGASPARLYKPSGKRNATPGTATSWRPMRPWP